MVGMYKVGRGPRKSHLRWEVLGEVTGQWAGVFILGVRGARVGLEHDWAHSRCSLSTLGLAWGISAQSLLPGPRSSSWKMRELGAF